MKKNTLTQDVVSDLKTGFEYLLARKCKSEPTSNYFITIQGGQITNPKHLNFLLKNKVFNHLHKKNRDKIINYLYVLEEPTLVSRGNQIPQNCYLHSHIVVDTNISLKIIVKRIEDVFGEIDIDIQTITDHPEKNLLIGYLTKQFKSNRYMDGDFYHFKIEN